LGVAHIGDGLVALPADARTIEALEWVADDILTAGGSATLWQATLTSRATEREVIAEMVAARRAEYEQLTAKAAAALAAPLPTRAEGMRRLRLVRRELRTIQRRDFFPPAARQVARTSVRALAERYTQPGPAAAADAVGVS